MSWDSYDKAADKGPFAIALKVILLAAALSIVVGGIGYVLGWFGEAATVAQEQFGARASLEKYEWFKDTAASLDKKQADIDVLAKRVERLEKRYASTKSRSDSEALNMGETELDGLVLSYNSLAAEYNAQMAKFNWKYANAGDMPKGATPLPREFKPYRTE